MSLKFKRNLPAVVLLVGILFSLVVFMGNQTIASYSFDAETLQASLNFDLSSEDLTGLQMTSMSQDLP